MISKVPKVCAPYRRPTAETAPVNAKASCLYANGSRALMEVAKRAYDNCLMLDMLGNVGEFANCNAFMVKDAVVFTPVPNGTFLDGVTRQRVIGLLRGAGVSIVETTLNYDDFKTADEIFSTGNLQKVAPMTRIDERSLPPGPIYKMARALYWEFAHDASNPDCVRLANAYVNIDCKSASVSFRKICLIFYCL